MVTHQGTETLHTPRLVLRRFTREDVPAMFRNWASDPEVTKYLTWPPHANEQITAQVVDSWIADYEKPDFYQWIIVLKGQRPEPIGSISVVEQEDTKAEIGYCIGKAWWHQGITSEALQAVMDYLFDQVGMDCLKARHDPRNPHSGNVMKKCGMKYIDTAFQSDRSNQGICDACHYALHKSQRSEGQ